MSINPDVLAGARQMAAKMSDLPNGDLLLSHEWARTGLFRAIKRLEVEIANGNTDPALANDLDFIQRVYAETNL